jgi:2-methylcitrate dehydratase PrpD
LDIEPFYDFDHLTKKITSFCSEVTFSDIPADVAEYAKLILLDTLGAILCASNPKYTAGKILTDFVRSIGGVEEAIVIGKGFKSTCTNAALVNGTLGYYCDIEAYDPQAVVHSAPAVVPACMAIAERDRLNGRQLLLAMIMGIDICCRISLALNPRVLYERGFHPTSVAGTIGAAAAAGRLLKLNSNQYPIALGLAGQQTSGLLAWKEDRSEHSRPLNCGVAAKNGLTAALLAKLGFGGPSDIFQGIYNIFRAYSSEGERSLEAVLSNLGTEYLLMEHAFKQYACCAFLHPGLDAMLSLMEEHDLQSKNIDTIVLRFPKSGTELIAGTQLRSHSAQYIFPIAAFSKQVLIDDILQDRCLESEIERLMKRMSVKGDETLDVGYPKNYPSIVEIDTTDKKRLLRRVDHAAGTPQNPFTRYEIEDKFFKLSDHIIEESTKKEIRDLTLNIEYVSDVSQLSKCLMGMQDCG